MDIATDTLTLSIWALEREQDRLGAVETTDLEEASENGQLVLDISRALTELRDILASKQR